MIWNQALLSTNYISLKAPFRRCFFYAKNYKKGEKLMAEYKLKMTQDEKTTVQNALINMRYSSAVDEILAEKLDALIAQLQALRPVQKLGYER